MQLTQPDLILTISEDNECPLYGLGDEFSLINTALVSPQGKPVCLILVGDIMNLLQSTGFKDFSGILPAGETLACSGCNGQIWLSRKTEPEAVEGKEQGAVINLLSNFSLFKALSEKNLQSIVKLLGLKKFEKGKKILEKGEPGRNLYIIVSGQVEVVGSDGIIIARLGPGEVFGEMSLLSGNPVNADVLATEPAKILYLRGKDFAAIFKKHPSLQLYFARLLAQRLAQTNIARTEEILAGMVGQLAEMPPAELFQAFHVNQKSGALRLTLPQGQAEVYFRDGKLLRASYNQESGREAFFAILKEKQGRFRFIPGLSEADRHADDLGDFLWLLMEGMRQIESAPKQKENI